MAKPLHRRAVLGAPVAAATLLLAGAAYAQAPLLTFDIASHGNPPPLLQLNADGTTQVRGTNGLAQTAALSGDARDALIDQLVTNFDLLSIDTDAITAEIKRLDAAGLPRAVAADGGETRIALVLPDQAVDLRLYATSFKARAYPEIDSLQRLQAAQAFLLDVYRDLSGQ